MREFQITNTLFFLEEPEGATLSFLDTEGDSLGDDVAVAYGVGMSWPSLNACREAIQADQVSWSMVDRSLTITGTRDELVLDFASPDPPYPKGRLILTGAELAAFRAALEALTG